MMISLFSLLLGGVVISHTHAINDFASLTAASLPAPVPLACHNQADTIQFVWRAKDGEKTDKEGVESQLTILAEQINGMFYRDSNSATEYRLPAWAINEDCSLNVQYIAYDKKVTIIERQKTIVVEDADTYCGLAWTANDDSPGAGNLNNLGSLAMIGRHCLDPYYVAHEIMHSFGAVQLSAPHSDAAFHTSELDLMGHPLMNRCPSAHDLIDCGYDDYWSLAPAPGSYLATHWNTADSVFLVRVKRGMAYFPIVYGSGNVIP